MWLLTLLSSAAAAAALPSSSSESFVDYESLLKVDTEEDRRGLQEDSFVFEDLLSYSYDLGEAGDGDEATDAGGFGKSFTLTDLNFGPTIDGTEDNSGRGDGFFVEGAQIRGNRGNGNLGISVSSAGDFDGDGIDDLIAGAPNARRAYIFFGQKNTFEFRRKLAERGSFDFLVSSMPLDSVLPIINTNMDRDDGFGEIVASAGDVNGDGFDDVAIAAPSATDSRGRVYIIYGSKKLCCDTLDVKNEVLELKRGFRVDGAEPGDFLGSSVSGGFDFDGDGYDDILMGADGFNGGEGAALLMYGRDKIEEVNRFDDIAARGGKENPRGVLLTIKDSEVANEGARPASLGSFVAGLDDVNGDDYDDIAIGADSYARNGAVFVVFGSGAKISGKIKVDELGGNDGFVSRGVSKGDGFGSSVSKAGDFNGDGFGDVVVGAPGVKHRTGSAYLIYGRPQFPAEVMPDLALPGKFESDFTGFTVSSAGDIDRDGLDDVLVGAFMSSPAGLELAGSVYAVLGGESKTGVLPLAGLDGFDGFLMRGGNPGDLTGYDVSPAGDFNNDGIDDIAITAFRSSAGVPEGGAVYMVFGSEFTSPPSFHPTNPTISPTYSPTLKPTSQSPTTQAVSEVPVPVPTLQPASAAPTGSPAPTSAPTEAPSAAPTTSLEPTISLSPTTSEPSAAPTTPIPSYAPTFTRAPTSSAPSPMPTDSPKPTTSRPSPSPSHSFDPTISAAPSYPPTVAPVVATSPGPTTSPAMPPSTVPASPTAKPSSSSPTTMAPSTPMPSAGPTGTHAPTTTFKPTMQPTESPAPTTLSPTVADDATAPTTATLTPSTATASPSTATASPTLSPTTELQLFQGADVAYVENTLRIENMTAAEFGDEEVMAVQFAVFDILGPDGAGVIDSTDDVQEVTGVDIASIDLSFLVELMPPSAISDTPLGAVEAVKTPLSDAMEDGTMVERLSYWSTFFNANGNVANVNEELTDLTPSTDSLAYEIEDSSAAPTPSAVTGNPAASPSPMPVEDGGSRGSSKKKKSNDGLNTGAIVGIVLAGLVVLILCVLLAWFFSKGDGSDDQATLEKDFHADEAVEDQGRVQEQEIPSDEADLTGNDNYSAAAGGAASSGSTDESTLVVVDGGQGATSTGVMDAQEKIIEADL